MGILQERSLRRVHAGVTARAFDLTIGGETFTRQVRSLSGTFDAQGGGSGMSIEVRDSLEGLEDARVELSVGYGDVVRPYFIGYLQEPGDLAGGKAAAYGPFKLMTDQSLGETVQYSNVSVADVLRDLEGRAGYGNGQVEVIGGTEDTVQGLYYTEDTKLSEVAKAVANPQRFVFYDRPAFRRRAMKIPRVGSGGTIKVSYSRAHYASDGFTVTDSREGHYSKVVVLRRDSAGTDEVRAEVPVANRGRFTAPANRIFYVSDFPGTDAEAEQEAYYLAHRLSTGEFGFSLNNIWLNPELEPWDTITCERVERRSKALSPTGKPGLFLVLYQCLISGNVGFNISATQHHMSPSGTAIRIGFQKMPDPIRLRLRPFSAGSIPPMEIPGLKPDDGVGAEEGLKPDVGLKPDSTMHEFVGGPVNMTLYQGVKPDVGLKPDVALKPETTHYSFKEL